jgi:putative endonuclease
VASTPNGDLQIAGRSRVLYVGYDLTRRVTEHKQGLVPGFTTRYRVTRLVYFEEFVDIREAITREKVIKGWVRSRKTRLRSLLITDQPSQQWIECRSCHI